MPFCGFEEFLEKFLENFLFSQKNDYLRNEHWYPKKVCFSYHIWKETNPEENLD